MVDDACRQIGPRVNQSPIGATDVQPSPIEDARGIFGFCLHGDALEPLVCRARVQKDHGIETGAEPCARTTNAISCFSMQDNTRATANNIMLDLTFVDTVAVV